MQREEQGNSDHTSKPDGQEASNEDGTVVPAEAEEETIAPSGESSSLHETATIFGSKADSPAEVSGAEFGRYRIKEPLGKGGMGAVYLAYDSALDRDVALKMPHLQGNEDSSILERFYREARAAANLNHVNLCQIYDVGEVDGQHYLTMPFVKGKPLSAYISPKKRLPIKQIIRLVRKLALAMHVAHEHGVIHRDLKPANILISEKGEPIIVDFGLARRVQRDTKLTQTGVGVGSPSYMPPEQVQGDHANTGPRCDVYSLGIILYEMMVGRPPFQGDLFAIIAQIIDSEPKPPSELRSDIPVELEAICLRAIQKSPDDRYTSMKEMADELTVLATPGGGAAQPKKPALAPLSNPDTIEAMESEPMLDAEIVASPVEAITHPSIQPIPTTAQPTQSIANSTTHVRQYQEPTQVTDLLTEVNRLDFYRRPGTKRWIAIMGVLSIGVIRLLSMINILVFMTMDSPGVLGWLCTGVSLVVSLVAWIDGGFAARFMISQDEKTIQAVKWLTLGLLIGVIVETLLVVVTFGIAPEQAMSSGELYSVAPDISESLNELAEREGMEDLERMEIDDPLKTGRYKSKVFRLVGWLIMRLMEMMIAAVALRLVLTKKPQEDLSASQGQNQGA